MKVRIYRFSAMRREMFCRHVVDRPDGWHIAMFLFKLVRDLVRDVIMRIENLGVSRNEGRERASGSPLTPETLERIAIRGYCPKRDYGNIGQEIGVAAATVRKKCIERHLMPMALKYARELEHVSLYPPADIHSPHNNADFPRLHRTHGSKHQSLTRIQGVV